MLLSKVQPHITCTAGIMWQHTAVVNKVNQGKQGLQETIRQLSCINHAMSELVGGLVNQCDGRILQPRS